MSDSPAAVAARYAAIERERRAFGDQRRHLSPEESAALMDDLWGPLPAEALRWAADVFGDEPAA